jgi:L-iditol 2-dehydrogenase
MNGAPIAVGFEPALDRRAGPALKSKEIRKSGPGVLVEIASRHHDPHKTFKGILRGNRSAVMTALCKIKVEERAVATPAPRQAVIRIEAVGACGSDTEYLKVGRIGDCVADGPLIRGHEVAGLVESVGNEVTNVKPGDRVAIGTGTPCRDSVECLAGCYHLCPKLVSLASPPYDGARIELVRIDSRNLFPTPDEMSFEQGALLAPLSARIWACQRANLNRGDRVLAAGAGPVGLLSAAARRALGAGSVAITDVSDLRLDLAKSMGFKTEKSPAPSDQTFDILIECPGVSLETISRSDSNDVRYSEG